jgi:hypothetical protein
MLGQWYTPLPFDSFSYIDSRKLREGLPWNHVEITFLDHIHSTLAHDAMISVYVHIRDTMAGTSTMQGEGSTGELDSPQNWTQLIPSQGGHQMYWNA